MKWYLNRKISVKIIIGFIVVAVIASLVGYVGVTNIKTVDSNDTALYEKMTVPIEVMGNVSTSFQRTRVNIRNMINADEIDYMRQQAENIDERLEEIDKLNSDFESGIISDEMQNAYNDYLKKWGTFEPMLLDAVNDVMDGKADSVTERMNENGELGMATRAVQDSIANLVSMKTSAAAQQAADNTVIANKAVTTMFIFIAIAALLALLLGWAISNIISKPLVLLKEFSDKLVLGDTDVFVKQKTTDEIGELMGGFAKLVANIQMQANYARSISKGELDFDIEIASEKDVMGLAMTNIVESLKNLSAESAALTKEAIEGNLKARGDVTKLEGEYRDIITGFNGTMDAIMNPLDIALDFLIDIANGEADDALDDADKYNGYFGLLITNLNEVFYSLLSMIVEVNKLTEEALEGNLAYRADVSKLKGAYANFVSEVNGTLDAVIEPVNEASSVLKELAKGNLSARVVGEYKGDHAEIKEALNFTVETIHGYIVEISKTLSDMANKDLTCGIEREYLGDFIELKDSINYIIGQFNAVLVEINEAAEQVEAAADQVASSSQILSQGSTEQASSVEEISASVTQVAEQTKENAANSNKANELSDKARTDAESGNKQMTEMLKAMNEIKESSANIAKIIKVIDDIAFQTNILALNAAVEAARAGEHGKGFAVVAEEVRNLAARSASAAKETTDMIDNSIKSVEDGYKMANETAGALEKIVLGVTDAVEIVGMIAEASNEQADAVNEINSGVEQISQVTQSNTATAEESASASEEMAGQAQLLKGMIEEFKLKGANSKKLIGAARSVPKLEAPVDNEMEFEISLNDSNFGKY